MIDNTTAVACLNHMGTSHSDSCNMMTQTIWKWCIDNHVWLSAAYIPGKENTAADEESRKINLDAEWKLNTDQLNKALAQLKMLPIIDLFASRLNNQMQCYASYRPDPSAYAVDTFSLSWNNLDFYAFPPFSTITAVLGKVKRESDGGDCRAALANTAVVATAGTADEAGTSTSTSTSQHADAPNTTRENPPSPSPPSVSGGGTSEMDFQPTRQR